MSRFSSFHPAVTALYFISVIGITAFAASGWLLAAALIGSVLFSLVLKKGRGFFRELPVYILMLALIAVTNPLFSHSGTTVLFFLNGNPVTLEAVLYGVHLAAILLAVILWFSCFNVIMTSDKLLYLFGRLSPKISLLLSSALRFIPLLRTQAGKIKQSQKAMGLFSSDAWYDRLRGNMRVFSALITWSLENAVDTGSSMKARGYGLRGRSHYSLYRAGLGDILLSVLIIISDIVILAALWTGKLYLSFYPSLSAAPLTGYSIAAVCCFSVLCLLPVIFEVREGLMWKYYSSKI